LGNGQDIEQQFAYLVQIKNSDDVTVYLSWITGTFLPGQMLSSSLSWIPQTPGIYDAAVFVWENIDDSTPLTNTVSITVNVN